MRRLVWRTSPESNHKSPSRDAPMGHSPNSPQRDSPPLPLFSQISSRVARQSSAFNTRLIDSPAQRQSAVSCQSRLNGEDLFVDLLKIPLPAVCCASQGIPFLGGTYPNDLPPEGRRTATVLSDAIVQSYTLAFMIGVSLAAFFLLKIFFFF